MLLLSWGSAIIMTGTEYNDLQCIWHTLSSEKPLPNQSQRTLRVSTISFTYSLLHPTHMLPFSFSNIEEGLFTAEWLLLQSRRLWYDGLGAEQTWVVEDRSPSAERRKNLRGPASSKQRKQRQRQANKAKAVAVR